MAQTTKGAAVSIDLTISNVHADDLDETLFDAIIEATEDQSTQEGYDLMRALQEHCRMMADALWYDLQRSNA